MKNSVRIGTAILIGIFGLFTLYLSGSIIFDLFDMREKQGNFVMFIIWTNFICGFLYLIGSIGLLKQKKWTKKVFLSALIILFLSSISFFIYVQMGGIHKTDTFKALTIRSSITLLALLSSIYTIKKIEKS